MVAGPEVARFIEELQDTTEPENRSQDTKHHDKSAVCRLLSSKTVIRMMEDFGNSFEEESQDLLVLGTKEIAAPPGAADDVFRAHKVGQV